MDDNKSISEIMDAMKSDDWNNDPFIWITMLILFFGFGNTTNIELEKEVSELKGKVDVIEKLVTK